MTLRPELVEVLDQLLAASASTPSVTLDAVGEALGARAVSTEEIDQLLSALEARGRVVLGPSDGSAEAHLRKVVATVRSLKRERASRPSLSEVAIRAELTRGQVLLALALLRVMQR